MREPISIWFFSGVLFLIYGAIITVTGLWELSHPLVHPPVLYNQFHPAIWWGALMGVGGLIYTIRFWPRVR
ncbi:hypothetical protein [Paracidobacterium acidisoli]|uniref:Uncharacterized protein n=1 Tax=Paracidobacterium acidisoli TaxID=2303751 RepID=A0A372IKG3_9BACT|nr:hypothetical protein [Paracidobacterium acidisoli]MBT9332747.1 hypothetical protein [Paracidobacterium acidisoli]